MKIIKDTFNLENIAHLLQLKFKLNLFSANYELQAKYSKWDEKGSRSKTKNTLANE